MALDPDTDDSWGSEPLVKSTRPRADLPKTRLPRARHLQLVAWPAAGLGLFLTAWLMASGVLGIDPILLPSPVEVVRAGARMIGSGELSADVLASLRRVAVGFLLAAALGVSIGALLGHSRRAASTLHPVLEILRPIPGIAWIPLAILWFGVGENASYFIVGIGGFFPVFLNTYQGVVGTSEAYLDLTRCLATPRYRVLLAVSLPASLPFIFVGLRVGLGVAWMTVIAAELVAAESGLGYMIQLNRSLLKTSEVIVGMLAIGMVGYIMSAGLKHLQRRFVPWQGKEF